MRSHFFWAPLLFSILLTGCSDSSALPNDAFRRSAEEKETSERREREKAEREKKAAEVQQREELKRDFETLLGHWDHPGGKGPDGKPLPALQLEFHHNHMAVCRMVVGGVDSNSEFHFELAQEEGQRLIKTEGSTHLDLTTLVYRLDRDRLILIGTATDPLLGRIDLSGEWSRRDWAKKTEAEIAFVLKKLDAELGYDEKNPAKPIVSVSFHFQAPVRNQHLRILEGLKQLHDLDLSNAQQITDDGLKRLVSLTQLRQLNLTGLQVSDETVHRLASELPGCRIVR
jgi:hypothetical protein